MRIFVTGISGFIGAQLVRTLLAGGHQVAGLVLFDDPLNRLQDSKNNIFLIRGLLENQEPWLPSLSEWQPEACIHLAWYVEPGKYLTSIKNVACLTDSIALLESLSKVGCSYFLGIGTCAEYDTNKECLCETDLTKPLTLYAASKLSFWLIGQQIALLNNIRFAWGRLFYPYGQGEDSRRLVPSAIKALFAEKPFLASDGKQIRDYIHVEDVAEALQILVGKKAGGVYNICSGKPVSIRDLLMTLSEIMGRPGLIQFCALPSRNWEPEIISGDNERLRNLGWSPKHSLKEGLQKTIAWWNTCSYKRNGSLYN